MKNKQTVIKKETIESGIISIKKLSDEYYEILYSPKRGTGAVPHLVGASSHQEAENQFSKLKTFYLR